MISNVILNVITEKLDFTVSDEKIEKYDYSAYKEIPINGDSLMVIRVSNHKTHLQTWSDRYKPTQSVKKKLFYSFVFENEATVGNTNVKDGRRIKVLQSTTNANAVDETKVNQIIQALSEFISTRQYNEEVLGKLELVTNKETINESNSIVKLTDNDLKHIIHETIRQVINESSNSNELRFEWLSELIEYLQELQDTDGDISVTSKSKDLLSIKKMGIN